MRPRFWVAALALLPSIALAQTPPSPAKVGITSTAAPEVVQILDNTQTWVPFGSINSTTHVFTPIGGGGVPGGTAGQVQYNNAGAFGGFTASGDATINTSTGAVAVTKTGGTAFGALATVTPGTGVATALGVNANAAGGVALVSTVPTAGNFVKWAAGGLVDGGAGGTSIIFPQTVSGTVTSGGIPYFSSTTVLSSSAALAANALVVGGGAGAAPSTITTGAGVNTALGIAPNTNGGVATATTTSVVVGAINTGGGSGTAPVGLADVATGSYLRSGGVTTIPAWQTFGTGAQTGVNTAINTSGGFPTASATSIVQGALNVGGGSAAALAGVADVATGSYLQSGGVTTNPSYQAFGTGVQTAVNAALNSPTGLAAAAAPLTASTGGTMTGAFGYYVCTTTCSVTLPTPAAGFQFCIRNDSTVVTVITIVAISSVQFEKTTFNGYGTVSTGKMTSGGALGDKICLIGRDATHYLVGSFVGVWTNT